MNTATLHKNINALLAPILIPPTRALIRYGPNGAAQRWLWNTVCRRLQGKSHPFEVGTRFGFRFAGDTVDLISSYIYYFGVWEPAISDWVYSLPLKGRTIIDVGAHWGWYSLLGARCVGPSGRVVAVEASPITFAKLDRNISINGQENVRLVNAAAWNTVSELRLYPGKTGDTGTTTVVPEFTNLGYTTSQAATAVIPAAPLSNLLLPEEVANAALVKIDVEGAEQQVLEGLAPLFPDFPDDTRFIIEITPEVLNASNRTSQDFLRVFTDHGFRPYVIRNEYNAEFYFDTIEQGSAKPTASNGVITRQTDLILSRLPL
jgi:FkbM family methyltransferase